MNGLLPVIFGLSVQSGVDARLSRGRSWVQIPYEPRVGGNVGSIPIGSVVADASFKGRTPPCYWLVASMVDAPTVNREVLGSSPSWPAKY
jgi:hypothetical protein